MHPSLTFESFNRTAGPLLKKMASRVTRSTERLSGRPLAGDSHASSNDDASAGQPTPDSATIAVETPHEPTLHNEPPPATLAEQLARARRRLHETSLEDVDIDDLDALERNTRKMEALHKRIQALEAQQAGPAGPSHANSMPSASSAQGRDRSKQDATLAKSNAPSLPGTSQLQVERWINEVEDNLDIKRLSFDDQTRSRWIAQGLRGHQFLADAVRRRVEASPQKGELLWAELKQLIRDSVQNPTLRRFSNAYSYENLVMKPGQKFQAFYSRIEQAQKDLTYEPPEDAKIDYIWGRLPDVYRKALTSHSSLKEVTKVEELTALIDTVEQAQDLHLLTKEASTPTGVRPPKRPRGGSAAGSSDRGRSGHRGQSRAATPADAAEGAKQAEGTPTAGGSHPPRKDGNRGPWRRGNRGGSNRQNNYQGSNPRGQQENGKS